MNNKKPSDVRADLEKLWQKVYDIMMNREFNGVAGRVSDSAPMPTPIGANPARASGIIPAAARVFLEASPVDLSPADIGSALAHVPGVVEVHDLHVWEVTSGFPALSAHVLVAADVDCHATRRGLEQMLTDRFDLHHTTLQVDHEPRELLELEVAPAARRAPDDEPRVSRGAATDRPR